MHPGETFGAFHLIAVLGRSSMDDFIYRATLGPGGPEVALRVHHRSPAPEPKSSAGGPGSCSDLAYPNLARLVAAGRRGGRSYAAIEPVPWPTLAEVLPALAPGSPRARPPASGPGSAWGSGRCMPGAWSTEG